MVRLLPAQRILHQLEVAVFQSHNGAIAASATARDWATLSSFNPTMVRLLRERSAHDDAGDLEFQSHNGAIAALCHR